MLFCLKHTSRVRSAGFAILLSCVSTATAATPDSRPRVRSVVRANAEGRLVRTIVVSPRKLVPSPAPAAATAADETIVSVPQLVEDAAKRHDVDPLLVHSVIQTESNYNPHAISPKGAQGLMQLMPATARRFGVRNSFDVKENIEGGVRYLKYLGTLFPDDPRLAIAAYNAGEGAVWKYGNTIPPYRETTQYVERVSARYGKARRAASQKSATTAAVSPVETTPRVEPEDVHAPVHVYVDPEGRLHLRNTPIAE